MTSVHRGLHRGLFDLPSCRPVSLLQSWHIVYHKHCTMCLAPVALCATGATQMDFCMQGSSTFCEAGHVYYTSPLLLVLYSLHCLLHWDHFDKCVCVEVDASPPCYIVTNSKHRTGHSWYCFCYGPEIKYHIHDDARQPQLTAERCPHQALGRKVATV